jgi:hypothetical protein
MLNGIAKYATGYLALCAVPAAVFAVLQVTHAVEAQGHAIKSDITIYLDGPLLDRGGTVFVVPREVPVDDWKTLPDQPNPARTDPRLDIRKPITERDRRLSVLASG